MNSKVPTTRQRNWISILPHIIVMGIIIFIWNLIAPKEAFLYGAITYLLISYLLRNLIPRDHRSGIKNNNSGKFKEAISDFQKSYSFFTEYEWVDNYRFIVLLSSSKISYKEMALVNIAFSYTQIGNGQKAKEYYKQALSEFPQSIIAKSALKMIEAAEENVLK